MARVDTLKWFSAATRILLSFGSDDFSLLSGEGECLDFGDPYYGNMFRCDNGDGQKYEVGRNFFELEK